MLCNYFWKKRRSSKALKTVYNVYGLRKHVIFGNVVHNIPHRFENNSALWIHYKKFRCVILFPVTNEYDAKNSLAICIIGNFFFLLLVDTFACPKYTSCVHGNKQHYKCSIVVVTGETNSKRINYVLTKTSQHCARTKRMYLAYACTASA